MSNAGSSLHRQRNYTRRELQDIARIRDIDLFEENKTMYVGCQGQAKGPLLVLWKRGLIPEHSLETYTNDGLKDAITGSLDLLYSLQHLLAECTDFKEEETSLKYLGA